jgi:dimethylhistidine N-methyltransferase
MTRVRIVDQLRIDHDAERTRLIDGLMQSPAHLEPKYFYDELGCALYAAICQLDEYYPTRTERAIFQAHRGAIAEAVGPIDTFVDLGAGDCCKAESWLPILSPSRYLAIDIAASALDAALTRLEGEFQDVEMTGLATDFSQTLTIPHDLLKGRSLFFYPGSSIGNFAPEDAVRFLQQVRAYAGDAGLLIGVDAKKDSHRLDAAYADALGVTAAFNLNALRHINRILSADFDESRWKHVGRYNEALGRVEMHLESMVNQRVTLDGRTREFAAGERIHSENSYKYGRKEFEELLKRAGFAATQVWSNDREEFWVFLAR